jgi:hypothetical protein
MEPFHNFWPFINWAVETLTYTQEVLFQRIIFLDINFVLLRSASFRDFTQIPRACQVRSGVSRSFINVCRIVWLTDTPMLDFVDIYRIDAAHSQLERFIYFFHCHHGHRLALINQHHHHRIPGPIHWLCILEWSAGCVRNQKKCKRIVCRQEFLMCWSEMENNQQPLRFDKFATLRYQMLTSRKLIHRVRLWTSPSCRAKNVRSLGINLIYWSWFFFGFAANPFRCQQEIGWCCAHPNRWTMNRSWIPILIVN